MPMVLIHQMSWRPSRCRARCWQLDGWRPQSSANTSRGLRGHTPSSATVHGAVEFQVAGMHHTFGKQSLGTLLAPAAHLLPQFRIFGQLQETIRQCGVIPGRGQAAGLTFLDDFAKTFAA